MAIGDKNVSNQELFDWIKQNNLAPSYDGGLDGGQFYRVNGGDSGYLVKGAGTYRAPSGGDSGGWLDPGGTSLDSINSYEYVPSFSAKYGNPDWDGGGLMGSIANLAPLMIAGGIGAGLSGAGLLGAATGGGYTGTLSELAADGLGGIAPSGFGTAAATAGAAGAANTAGGNGMWDWLSNLVGGGSSGASQFIPSIANASDPIEAMQQAMTATGTTSASEAASALGFNSPETMLSSINPAWTGASFGTMLNNAGNIVNGARSLSGGGSLLGTALGGLLGSMNGAKQAGTTTTTQTPWAGQQPYLLDAFERARTSANGTPLQTQANANYSSVLSGPTKNPMLGMDNPYLTKAIDNANTDVTRAMMPAIDQANHASGSFGNSGVADTYGKNLTDAYSRNATGMRMQDYTNQQNLYQQAVGNTLGFTSNANNYTAQPAQNYAQTIQGNYGSSTTTPYFNNPMAGIMGGAMVGNKIGANLGF